jgi:uncharacterized membrane protein YfcA
VVIVAAVVIITACAAVQGAVGFGMNLLAVPLLLVLDPRFVPGPALVAGLVLSVLVAGRELREMDRRIGWALVGLLPGTMLGLLLLAAIPEDDLAVPLGLLVLFAVGLTALRWAPAPTGHALLGAGFASGFMTTAASIGGPPMALLYARDHGARLRSTLSGFFAAAAVVAIVALALDGRFTTADAGLAAPLVPGAVVGFLLSGRLRPFVDAGRSRPIVLALSAIAAIIAIAQGLLA